MMEPFLINPPRRRYSSNPLGVEELAVLNPPKRRAKKRRTKVATRKKKRNSKGQFIKGGVAKKRHRRTTKRRSVARRTSPKRRRSTSRQRTRIATLRRHSVYVTNPKRRRRSYRRNPGIGLSMGSIVPTLKEGAFIALGAVAVGHAMARLPYVSTLTGPTRHLARLGVAILGGKLISKFLKQPALGKAFAMGGVVATALQVAAEQFPSLVPLSSTDEMALGMYYTDPTLSLGEYNMGHQPDGLSFETDMPERLSQNRF
jgi:hypothetical protein